MLDVVVAAAVDAGTVDDVVDVIWFSPLPFTFAAVVVIVNGVVILNGLIPLTLIDCGNGTGWVDEAGDKSVGVGVCHP